MNVTLRINIACAAKTTKLRMAIIARPTTPVSMKDQVRIDQTENGWTR